MDTANLIAIIISVAGLLVAFLALMARIRKNKIETTPIIELYFQIHATMQKPCLIFKNMGPRPMQNVKVKNITYLKRALSFNAPTIVVDATEVIIFNEKCCRKRLIDKINKHKRAVIPMVIVYYDSVFGSNKIRIKHGAIINNNAQDQ